jgi:hypothetical protein
MRGAEFFEVHASTKSPIAAHALAQIAALYAIEAEIRGQPAALRQAARQERSRPIIETLYGWLNQQLPRISKATQRLPSMLNSRRFERPGKTSPTTSGVLRSILSTIASLATKSPPSISNGQIQDHPRRHKAGIG